MEKTKGQKIAYSVITVILAIVLGVILLNRFGIVDFKGEINQAVNSDYYWQSEPFGDLNAVWCLESCDAKEAEYMEGSSLKRYLRSPDGSKEYDGGSSTYVKNIKNLKYGDDIKLYDIYFNDGISYAAIFVPMDCEYAVINNGEPVQAQIGHINTPDGVLDFKYITTTYKRLIYSENPQPDTLILFDGSGQPHEYTDDWSE